ncbi:MAG: hypothetical protein AAF787_00100 [Chloroflexota bacterium]
MAKKSFGNALDGVDHVIHNGADDAEAQELLAGMRFGRKRSTGNAITPLGDGAMTLGGWQMTKTGLIAPENISETDYAGFGRALLQLDTSMQWLLGDYIAIGDEYEYGETYKQIAEEFGYSINTLYEYVRVCKAVDFSIRIENLSFKHHQIVASMEPEQQSQWLNHAANEGLSSKALRQAIKQAQLPASTPPPAPTPPPAQPPAAPLEDEPHTTNGLIAGNIGHHAVYGIGQVEEVIHQNAVLVRFEGDRLERVSAKAFQYDGPATEAAQQMDGGLSSRMEPELSTEPYAHAMDTERSRQRQQWIASIESLLADYVHHPEYNPEAYSYHAYSLKIIQDASPSILSSIPANELPQRMNHLLDFEHWMTNQRSQYGGSEVNFLLSERDRIERGS